MQPLPMKPALFTTIDALLKITHHSYRLLSLIEDTINSINNDWVGLILAFPMNMTDKTRLDCGCETIKIQDRQTPSGTLHSTSTLKPPYCHDYYVLQRINL